MELPSQPVPASQLSEELDCSQQCSQDTVMISASQNWSQLTQEDCSPPLTQEEPSQQEEPADFGEPEDWCDTQSEADRRSFVPRHEPRCLLPDTRVLTLQGPIEASPGLTAGMAVRSGRIQAVVEHVEVHEPALITTVKVTLEDGGSRGSVTVTDSHAFLARRPPAQGWGCIRACGLAAGDETRGPNGELRKVVAAETQEDMRAHVQVWLDDPAATLYVAGFGQALFVEAYGTERAPPAPEVEILRFSTSGGLRCQLMEAPTLQENHKALGKAGISTELHEQDMGYGILAVRPDLAGRAVLALHARKKRKRALPSDKNGGRLNASEVVVSADLKLQVIQAATAAYHRGTGATSGKHRYVKHAFCEALDLTDVVCPDEVLALPPPKRARLADNDSQVTASTTAARERVTTHLRPLGR